MKRFAELTEDEQTRATMGVALGTALLLFTGVVLWARLAGTLPAFPGPMLAFSLAGGAAVAGLFALQLTPVSNAFSDDGEPRRWLPIVLAVLPGMLTGLALAAPGAVGTQLSVLTFCIAAAALTERTGSAERNSEVGDQEAGVGGRNSEVDDQTSDDRPALCEVFDAGVPPAAFRPPVSSPPTPDSVEPSPDSVEGVVCVSFLAGQKQAVAHVAFVPAMSSVPAVECEPLDDVDVRWKTAVVQPYGFRLDVHRNGDLADALTVSLAYFAAVNVPQQSAA